MGATVTEQARSVGEPITIRLISAVYFVATKLEAFAGRGRGDPYGSRGLEDIVTLIAGRPGIVGEISAFEAPEVAQFIRAGLAKIARDPGFCEAGEGHLNPATRKRLPIVLDRIARITRDEA